MPARTNGSGLERCLDSLSDLYARMEEAYNEVAGRLGLTCDGCPNNCCLSYFQHHTYIEWAYLWLGLQGCGPARLEGFKERAREYVQSSREALSAGKKPSLMCPLNEDGWCGLYASRMMICRLHGVPNRVSMPDGRVREFPGCGSCQELIARKDRFAVLDRTPFYIELARLEHGFLSAGKKELPRVKLTLAEMIVQGPPPVGIE